MLCHWGRLIHLSLSGWLQIIFHTCLEDLSEFLLLWVSLGQLWPGSKFSQQNATSGPDSVLSEKNGQPGSIFLGGRKGEEGAF